MQQTCVLAAEQRYKQNGSLQDNVEALMASEMRCQLLACLLSVRTRYLSILTVELAVPPQRQMAGTDSLMAPMSTGARLACERGYPLLPAPQYRMAAGIQTL